MRELEFDSERRQALVAGYMSQTGESDTEAAWSAMNADIDRLRQTFERVDAHLNRIDRYRAKVEHRVADHVRYLDRTQPGQSARLARLYQRLGSALDEAADASELDWLPLIGRPPLGSTSLFQPRRSRRPPEPAPVRARNADPGTRARQDALRAYLDRRRVDPKRIEGYLLAQLDGATTMSGQAMRIQSVEEFIAFTHLRHLPYLDGAGSVRDRYRIERIDEPIDNDWVRCPGFVIHRQTEVPNHAA